MGVTVTTAPTVYPVTLEEAKTHLRIDANDQDAYINGLIAVAVELAQVQAGRQFCTATLTLKLASFPADNSRIELPRPPLARVTSITYKDGAGTTQTLAANTDYEVVTDEVKGFVAPCYGETWPSTCGGAEDVTIIYVAGYGTAAAVPAAVKHAIKLILGDLYANREAQLDYAVTENQAVVNLLATVAVREAA